MGTIQENDKSNPDLSGDDDNDNVRTVDDVGEWLKSLGYVQYVDTFAENEVDGRMLRSLTSQELRDDLKVTSLHHRRVIGEAISKLPTTTPVSDRLDRLPEHGRILDHLSNVRTYHSWLRVGVQFLSFAIVTLRLTPDFRSPRLISGTAYYFAAVAVLARTYAVYRYRCVIRMIETSRLTAPTYRPDAIGAASLVVLIIVADIMGIIIIAHPAGDTPEAGVSTRGLLY